MGAIVIRTRYDEGAESSEVATSAIRYNLISTCAGECRLTIACLNLLDIAEVRARGHNSSVYGECD
jgi:hypothetical protein